MSASGRDAFERSAVVLVLTPSLLRTTEDIFGLPHLANAGQAGAASLSSDVLKSAFPKAR
jgi:hypothetical protein